MVEQENKFQIFFKRGKYDSQNHKIETHMVKEKEKKREKRNFLQI